MDLLLREIFHLFSCFFYAVIMIMIFETKVVIFKGRDNINEFKYISFLPFRNYFTSTNRLDLF